MGAAVAGLPLGLVIGAVAGCVIVLRLRRNAGAGSVTGKQGLAALGVTAAILLGLYGYFFWEPPKPRFKGNPPLVLAEIRMPTELADLEYLKGRRSLLRTYEDTYYDANMVLEPRVEGENVILTTRHELFYRRDDRAIHVWVRVDRLLIFELGLADDPLQTESFSDWQPADHVRPGFYEEDIPASESEGVAIRLKVIRPVS